MIFLCMHAFFPCVPVFPWKDCMLKCYKSTSCSLGNITGFWILLGHWSGQNFSVGIPVMVQTKHSGDLLYPMFYSRLWSWLNNPGKKSLQNLNEPLKIFSEIPRDSMDFFWFCKTYSLQIFWPSFSISFNFN